MLENYKKLDNGLIKQNSFFSKLQNYNIEYIKQRYDSYKELSIRMSYLRMGYLTGVVKKIDSLIDVGYGNGDFLNVTKEIVKKCYGFEVNCYNIPEGCIKINNIYENSYDVVCFFDVLEHFEDIYEIKNLKTNYIYISVPECHYFSDEWFEKWKHRRPDEHLWHFNKQSLKNFMEEIGYELIQYSNIEDCIRKSSDVNSNILTGIFKKL